MNEVNPRSGVSDDEKDHFVFMPLSCRAFGERYRHSPTFNRTHRRYFFNRRGEISGGEARRDEEGEETKEEFHEEESFGAG